ncbi:MAG: cation transporter [Chloroflexota bacterium]|nr:cation transporter [Chloroflexota bacterium]MDQ6910375.1 cation transporter [Actinomycetota bacterium]
MTELSRQRLLRRGLRLEYLTVAWNLVEGLVSIGAALASGSVALLGFGVDSFVESVSGVVLIWRLSVEQRGELDEEAVERVEYRAERFVAISLLLLGAYILVDAIWSLVNADRPSASPVGIVVTALSLGVMGFLARAKRTTGQALGSRALIIDAFQTTTCLWLSATTLVGLAANALLGWWWADPVAAIVIALLVLRESIEAWRGEEELPEAVNETAD